MSPTRPKSGFQFTVADLLCVVAFVGVAIGLPISWAQVIDVKQHEKVLPFGSQRKTQDASQAVDYVSVVIVKGQIVLMGWQVAIRKLPPVPHLVVLAGVGAYARRRTKPRANGPVPLDGSLRDAVAVSTVDSPAAALPGRDTAGRTVRWCFACMDAIALLAVAVSLLLLSLVWFGPVATFFLDLACWGVLCIGALVVDFNKRRRPAPRSTSGQSPPCDFESDR
jgi:hypothetical protein